MRAWQHSHTVYLNRGDFFFLSPAAVQMVNKILWANGMRPHNILGIVTRHYSSTRYCQLTIVTRVNSFFYYLFMFIVKSSSVAFAFSLILSKLAAVQSSLDRCRRHNRIDKIFSCGRRKTIIIYVFICTETHTQQIDFEFRPTRTEWQAGK